MTIGSSDCLSLLFILAQTFFPAHAFIFVFVLLPLVLSQYTPSSSKFLTKSTILLTLYWKQGELWSQPATHSHIYPQGVDPRLWFLSKALGTPVLLPIPPLVSHPCPCNIVIFHLVLYHTPLQHTRLHQPNNHHLNLTMDSGSHQPQPVSFLVLYLIHRCLIRSSGCWASYFLPEFSSAWLHSMHFSYITRRFRI